MMNCYTNPNSLLVVVASFIVLSTQSHFTISGVLAIDLQYDHHDGTNETGPEFSYIESTGRGPSKWGELNPAWKACGDGSLQSPIDFVYNSPCNLGKLTIDYKPAPATLINMGNYISVTWNGADAGKININGTDYGLKQLHWHSPTEHSFNGIRKDLELHIVHSTSDNRTAVVGILYGVSGSADPFLSKLTDKIKSLGSIGSHEDLGSFDPNSVGFGNIGYYYRYNGSLTTPPCTEGVVWTVFRDVRTVSEDLVQALKYAVADGFEANARPTQASNGRPVCLYAPQESIPWMDGARPST